MKTLHRNLNELFKDCIIIILMTGTIGIALKFTTFFDKWVFFPSFPNICDAAFLILSVAYLTWRVKSTTVTKRTKIVPHLSISIAQEPNNIILTKPWHSPQAIPQNKIMVDSSQ